MGVKALATALQVLEMFNSARPEHGVTQISIKTGLGKSHVSKILQEFCRVGLLKQDPVSRRYRVGPRSLNLGAGYLVGWDFGRCGLEALRHLVDETGCTATLNALDHGSILFAASRSGKGVKRTPSLPVGSYLPLHATAAGKISAAFLPHQELVRLLGSRQLPAITPNSIRNPNALLHEIATSHRNGFARTRGESTPGLAGIAVPVIGSNRDYQGALSLLTPVDQTDDSRERQLLDSLWTEARRLSYRLGADDYPYAHGAQ